jgi:DNA polymerase/3'-5' exonuclease PolX
MSNQKIIENISKLIKLLEFQTLNLNDTKQKTINQFRISSLKKSLKIIIKYNKKIISGSDLKDIKGIGKGTIARIDEILKTGTLADLKNYDKIISKYSDKESIINDLMNVIGIGRKIAINLIDEYNIKSVDQLKKLSDSGKIELNDKLKLGLKWMGKFKGSIPRTEIDQIYDYLQELTNKYNKSMFITICGSYRRELPFASDIDILLCSLDINTNDDIILTDFNPLSEYVKYLHQENFLIDDITDKNIKTKYMGFGKYKNNHIRRVDIRLIPMISYFPALLYFTGSYEFNQEMRSKAKKMGYTLNEYGLYDNRLNEMIIILSEQEMFNKLEMSYLAPNER